MYPGLMPTRPAPELPPVTGSPGPGRPKGPAPPLPPRLMRYPAPHTSSPTHHAMAHTDTSTLYGPGQSGEWWLSLSGRVHHHTLFSSQADVYFVKEHFN